MDQRTLAERLAARHHVSDEFAQDMVSGLIAQIGSVDGTGIDPDDIAEPDAVFIEGAFAAALANESEGRGALEDELSSVSAQLRDLQREADGLASDRNALVRRLWGAGATVRDIVEASGLNQSRVYAIINSEE